MNERFKLIKEYIENRDVLNIGCVDTIDPYLIDKYQGLVVLITLLDMLKKLIRQHNCYS